MLALSGYPQWFWLMLQEWHNRKDVENRRWPLPKHISDNLPVRIYLHGSKHLESYENLTGAMERLTFVQVDLFRSVNWKQYQGAIMGELTIVSYKFRHGENNANLYSDWHIPGQYGFYTASPKLYKEPIPYRGQLGFFNVELKHAIQ